MTVEDAQGFLRRCQASAEKMDALRRVGLGYIKWPAGDHAVRAAKAHASSMSKEPAKRSTGGTPDILD